MFKYEAFLGIARELNAKFGVRPLLFGSLGLERRLGADLAADDIDILLPEVFLGGRWPELLACMEELGFRLYDLHEHAFSRDGVDAAFASLESLRAFAGVDPALIPALSDGGAEYLLLTLEDYLKVYTASAKDGYRRDKRQKNDARKIEIIRTALGC